MATNLTGVGSYAPAPADARVCIDLTNDGEMERPRPDILPSHENYHVSPSNLLDHLPGDLYRDPQSPEFATDEGSTSPENTQKVIQAIGNNDEPILSGKYPRLKNCPPHRAPRDMTYILKKAKKSATARAQQKRVGKYRKRQRHSPVPMRAENTTQKESYATKWPPTSLALRPKPRASRKPNGHAVDVNDSHKAGLSLRPKLGSEKP